MKNAMFSGVCDIHGSSSYSGGRAVVEVVAVVTVCYVHGKSKMTRCMKWPTWSQYGKSQLKDI